MPGPFRAILGDRGHCRGDPRQRRCRLGGAGGAEHLRPPTAIEPRVLLLEDLARWPDEQGVEELALRFGARVDLAFGGSGERHLDRGGPETGRFTPRW